MMSITTHLQAVEASAQAAALSAQALLTQIAAFRAALKQQVEENPAVELPMVCPKCGSGVELHIATSDGRMACRKCSAIF
jgi:ribosomal protein S27AE